MLAAVGAYSLAAVLDVRTRRVPNAVWLALLVYLLWQGVTLRSVVSAVGMLLVGLYAWRVGDIGGADVKGVALLPLALPQVWPVAVLAGFTALGAWQDLGDREEFPVFAPLLIGVAAALVVGLLS